MNTKKLIPLLLIIVLLALPFTLAANEDKEVKVGLYLLNLGKYDVSSGSFTADFYLSLKCNYNCSPENFEFMNGRASSVDLMENTPTEKFYRIQANLNSKVDLRKFPFDKQEINIILEDKEKTNTELKYVPDLSQSGIDPSITFTGWNIDSWRAEEKDHEYPIYNQTYSQYSFNIDLSRILFNSFLKTILPVAFILLVVLFSFVIDPDKVTTRLSMAGSSLVAAVMFHVSIANQNPPVSYLTFADKFLLLTYLVLLVSFIINITMIELQERKNHEQLMRLHRYTEFSMLILVPICYILLFILLL